MLKAAREGGFLRWHGLKTAPYIIWRNPAGRNVGAVFWTVGLSPLPARPAGMSVAEGSPTRMSVALKY
jgi:hypothetical protein